MNMFMTHSTHWYNIKVILFCITKIMMVVFCGLFACIDRAYEIFYRRYSSHLDSIFNCGFSSQFDFYIRSLVSPLMPLFAFFGISVFSTTFSLGIFAFFCLSVFFVINFKILLEMFFAAFSILFNIRIYTFLALSMVAVTGCGLLVKLREGFNFIAFTASFGYDCLRHTCFSIKHLCLEPVSGHLPVSGLSYCMGMNSTCQLLFKEY